MNKKVKIIVVTTLLATTLFASTATAIPSSYKVEHGDTLWKISKETGVPIQTIKNLNHLQGDTILIGQTLKLADNSSTHTYEVQKGNTLYEISKKYNVSITDLKKINGLKSDTIHIGQTLKVPVKGSNKIKGSSIQETAIKPNKKVSKEVIGFTMGDSYKDVVNNKDSLTSIATATYDITPTGRIVGKTPVDQIKFVKENSITPTMMIANHYDRSISNSVLRNPIYRKNLVKSTIDMMKTNGYQGVNVDIENVSAEDRHNFTKFIQELSLHMKPYGYSLSVSVAAKMTDNPKHTWNYAYDYKEISKYVDYVMVMAYNEHYSGGQPGPIASIGWVNQVIDYSLSVIPKDKIVLAVGSYGYDWGEGQKTRSYGMYGAIRLAKEYNATIHFDKKSKSPYFKYKDKKGVQHQVWFENEQSLSYKLDLVNQKGLKGIGVWRLGLDNPDYWGVISKKL